MTAGIGIGVFAAGIAAMAVIRAPHIRRSTRIGVDLSRRTGVDNALVAAVSLGLIVPLAWIATPLFDAADRDAGALSIALGVAAYALGLWLLHRSHVDLGTNWSNTLELRPGHTLVTRGIYRRVRHPMYAALMLYGLGQALVLGNWLAGLSFLVPLTALVACRLGSEERMMTERFGAAYAAYADRTRRLIPLVW